MRALKNGFAGSARIGRLRVPCRTRMFVRSSHLSRFEVESLLRRTVARQVLGLLADASEMHHTLGKEQAMLCTAEWPRKYGIHTTYTPLHPHAWTALERALATAQTGNQSAALSQHLTPTGYAVPPTKGPEGGRCSLSPAPVCPRFLLPELNAFVGSLFAAVANASALQPSLPQVSLSRYDLFHAHLFLAVYQPSSHCDGGSSSSSSSFTQILPSRQTQCRQHREPGSVWLLGQQWRSATSTETDRLEGELGEPANMGLGLLFHCKEYPAFHEERFPYHLGYCQAGSDLAVGPDFCMRNVVFFKGMLAFLDAGRGMLAHDLLWPEVKELCTIFEHDLGSSMADITYFEDGANSPPSSVKDLCQYSVYVAASG